jgi:DNA-binding response OmpR family regulator
MIISRDQMLLQTRKMLLGAFFEVEAAGRVTEAMAIIGKDPFDLIVLCYTLSENDCRLVTDLALRQVPPPKILMMTAPGGGQYMGEFREHVTVQDGPYAPLKKSAEMLGVSLKGRGRMFRN